MQLDIKITGVGTRNEIAAALTEIAHNIANGDYLVELETKGECEWEDSSLFVHLTESTL
jgi:hypothetical protein